MSYHKHLSTDFAPVDFSLLFELVNDELQEQHFPENFARSLLWKNGSLPLMKFLRSAVYRHFFIAGENAYILYDYATIS